MNLDSQKIIDAHHHLWDPNSNKYDWLTAPGHEVFNNVYKLENFVKEFENLNIIKSVHIQAEINIKDTIYESQWLQDCFDNNDYPSAIIGFADFLDLKIEQNLANHIKFSNFRGIRQILNFDEKNKDISHAKIDYLNNETWIKNFSLLEKYDLIFDLSILYSQTNDAIKLIKKYQNTLFIINHALSPMGINKENINDWLDKIKLISSFDNVVIKLSGFGEFNSNWTEESIKPLILSIIDYFGIGRCMFGSNFPVDKYLSNSRYYDYWESYFNIVSDFNNNEKDKLFYLNAEKFYKI